MTNRDNRLRLIDMVAKESFALKYNIIDNALRVYQTRGLGSMPIQILLIFDLRNYFVIYFCCGVIAILANIDIFLTVTYLILFRYFYPKSFRTSAFIR